MKKDVKCCAAIVAIVVAFILSSTSYAGTIDALIGGNDLQLEYANGVVVIVSFSADGTYKTNTGSSGTWTLRGERLCTVRNGDGVSGCGRLPIGKLRGAVWTSKDADGVPVTARIARRR